MATVEFGVMLPQIKRSWEETKSAATEMDRLGYHSVWFNDHLYGIPMPQIPILEAWTALSAVGAVTAKAELGTLVSPIGFRNPALFAKMVATLDQITGGRVIVGLGSGWFAQEFSGYGIDFPPVQDRLAQLDEGVQLMRRMWEEPQVTFNGRYFHTDEVYCEPKPTRRPPILIGGGGEKVLLRLVARYADIWNNMGMSHREIPQKLAVLRAHCERIGRNPGEIEISQQTIGAISLSADEARRRTEAVHQEVGFLTGAPELCPTGTPDEIVRRLRLSIDMGITTFIISFGRHTGAENVRLFGREVIPAFR